MANNAKIGNSGNGKLYIGVLSLTLLWLLLTQLTSVSRRLDYNWDHFILNLPSKIYLLDITSPEELLLTDPNGHSYSFGKYITKFANPKITIAAIDDDSIAEYGWPIPRGRYGELVDRLKSYGVKGVIFDVILSKSKNSNREEDQRFVSAVARAGNVGNLVTRDSSTDKIVYPIDGLIKASAVIAHPNVDSLIDDDGQVRKYLPFWGLTDALRNVTPITYAQTELKNTPIGKEFPDMPIPSIGIAGLSMFTGKHLSQLYYEYSDQMTGGAILSYRNFKAWKKHPGWSKDEKEYTQSSFRHISFVDILQGRLSKEEKEALKGGLVLVGSTALGAFDHSPSPFAPQLPGVEVHATFIDNAIAGDFRKPLSELPVILLILALPWVPVLLRKYSISTLVLACLGIMAAMMAVYVILLGNNVLMPFASVMLPFVFGAAYITVDKGLSESREKKWIKGTFGQYLSPKVVELVTKDPSKLSLGGEKRDMTAFFLDLAGFTTMSEKLSPEELTAMLVEYLSAFTEVIMKHDGTVDKYIGDCVVAFWNAPMDQADHRKLGVLAAIDCQSEMARLNEALTQFAIKPKCRVGVNSGPMVVGNMGSKQRLSYTVMGDSVNMASRMEGANKFFHSKIMTSEYTFDGIKDDFDYRYLGSIRVVGKVIPVKVYEPFARKGEAPADIAAMLKHYNAGQEKFYKGDFAGAAPHFKAALEARPGDGPAEFYLQKSELFAKEPIKDWDQSFNLTEKG